MSHRRQPRISGPAARRARSGSRRLLRPRLLPRPLRPLYARSVVEQVHADAPVPVTLSGHTHRTRIHIRHTDGSFEEIDPWEHTARTQVTFALNLEDANYILNCGNTSQLLFDRLPSVCGLLDTDEQTITWQRLH